MISTKLAHKRAKQHSLERAKQRYELSLTVTDLTDIARQIKNKKSVRLYHQSRHREHHAIKFRGQWLPIVYNPQQGVVVTILPKNELVLSPEQLEGLLLQHKEPKSKQYGIYSRVKINGPFHLQKRITAVSPKGAVLLFLQVYNDYQRRWEQLKFHEDTSTFTLPGQEIKVMEDTGNLQRTLITQIKDSPRKRYFHKKDEIPQEFKYVLYVRFRQIGRTNSFKETTTISAMSGRSAAFSYVREKFPMDFHKRWDNSTHNEDEGYYSFGWMDIKPVKA